MQLLRQRISASYRILDRFYVISMEFWSLSHRRSSVGDVPSCKEQGETDVVAGSFAFDTVYLYISTLSSLAYIGSTAQHQFGTAHCCYHSAFVATQARGLAQ